jgi:hypothetical protein
VSNVVRTHAETVARLREVILETLAGRADGATMCPSEAAREVGGDGFRMLMPAAREAAAALVAVDAIVVTQRGEEIDLSVARGPVRLRLRQGRRAPLAQSTPPPDGP